MLRAKLTDILIVGVIAGIVAVLTSFMGVTGTVIGSVISSILAEFMKTFFKEPIKDKIVENEEQTSSHNVFETTYEEIPAYTPPKKQRVQKSSDNSLLTNKLLFIYPLIVILIIELISFLVAIHILPYHVMNFLESATNWRLFRTIGYALIIMGIYPIVSKKLGVEHGIILIVIGIIQLIIGYADTNMIASTLYSFIDFIRNYITIAVIIGILYTVLTVPDEIEEHKKAESKFIKPERTFNNDKFSNNKFKKSSYGNNNKSFEKNKENSKYKKDEDDGYYFYYDEGEI